MFTGSFVALITPMTEEKEIDWPAFEELIEWQIREKTNGLVLAGTTGEAATLSSEEKLSLFKKGVEIAHGRVPIIAGTGVNSTQATVELTRAAKALGVDAALLVVPYYNRPSEAGCMAHFLKVAEVDLPFILYHHPIRTGVRLSVETMTRICEIPQVIGIKEASGDIGLGIELLQRIKKPIFSGDDLLALPHLSIGFSGTISIVGNVIPGPWGDFVRQPSRESFFYFYPFCRSLLLETNPQGVKYALSLLGKCQADLRLPLVTPQSSTQNQIEEAFKPLLMSAGF